MNKGGIILELTSDEAYELRAVLEHRIDTTYAWLGKHYALGSDTKYTARQSEYRDLTHIYDELIRGWTLTS